MAIIQTGLGKITKTGPVSPVVIGGARRQFLANHGLGQTTPNCQYGMTQWQPYQCCAEPNGQTPCAADPCCILNNPAFIQQQSTEVATDVSNLEQNEAPGNSNAMLANMINAGLQVPTNIAQDAQDCFTNPGATFTDSAGVRITCPSGSTEQAAGIFVSQYSVEELTSMLNNQYGAASPNTAGNVPQANVQNVLDATTPTHVTVTPTGTNNALSSSAGQTSSSNTPTQGQINNSKNVTGNASNGQGGGSPTSDVVIGGVDITSWIEQNWVIVAVGAAALLLLPNLMKGGR